MNPLILKAGIGIIGAGGGFLLWKKHSTPIVIDPTETAITPTPIYGNGTGYGGSGGGGGLNVINSDIRTPVPDQTIPGPLILSQHKPTCQCIRAPCNCAGDTPEFTPIETSNKRNQFPIPEINMTPVSVIR